MATRPATKLTPSQRRTFDELLAAGMDRPTMPTGLVDELRDRIADGTADAAAAWTESRLYVTKSSLQTVGNCEGMLAAQRAEPPTDGMFPAVAVGVVAHQAIQIAHTHPGHPVATYVGWAVDGCVEDDAAFAQLWTQSPPARQSNLRTQMVSRVSSFLDTFPPLDESWTPRFEEPVQAKAGRTTLSTRPDLVLGRPRTDGRQTMLIVDFKTGGLHDGHLDEARFYALVATLRHGIAPFRSTVLSLASGDWTDPDVTADVLRAEADRVVRRVNQYVDVLTGARPPELTAGPWCRFCPARDDCAAHATWQQEQAAA